MVAALTNAVFVGRIVVYENLTIHLKPCRVSVFVDMIHSPKEICLWSRQSLLEVNEVIRKSEQGMGGAYFCTGDDGSQYWVKGVSAQRDFQVNEWLAGHLAKAFGLPIAHFCLIQIDYMFSMYLPVELKDIGAGAAFASQHVSGTKEPNEVELNRVPESLKRDLLMFDYWVQNADRTFGNSNLLWLATEQRLVVIDHNLAFDEEFSAQGFFGRTCDGMAHVFADMHEQIFSDLVEVELYKQKMETCLPVFEQAIASVPREWNFTDADEREDVEIDYGSKRRVLERFNDDEFWGLK